MENKDKLPYSEWLKTLPAEQSDWIDERVAILRFDAGLPEKEAQSAAWKEWKRRREMGWL